MEIICLEDEAFFNLFDRVLNHIKEKQGVKPDKWISGEEAMKILRITSKTTLQDLRDSGKVRFSQPAKKTFSSGCSVTCPNRKVGRASGSSNI